MSSSTEDSSVNTMGIRGFPEKCGCGRSTLIYTSKSKTNPGRPFFRCPTLRNDHVFKWVEEAVLEEVEDALPKVECFESEICKTKADIEGMKNVMEDLMEELTKTKLKLERLNLFMKVGFGIICITITVGVLVIMIGKSKGSNLSSY